MLEKNVALLGSVVESKVELMVDSEMESTVEFGKFELVVDVFVLALVGVVRNGVLFLPCTSVHLSSVVACSLFLLFVLSSSSISMKLSCLSRIRGVNVNGGWRVLKKIRMRNVVHPVFKLFRDGKCTGCLIAVACPDKLQSITFASLHVLSLGLKLKAIIIGMVAKGDVFVPGGWVSDRFVC